MTRPQAAPDGAGECAGAVRAAQLLGVHERTVRRWADEGRLPVAYTTAGGHRRYRLADVEALALEPAGAEA